MAKSIQLGNGVVKPLQQEPQTHLPTIESNAPIYRSAQFTPVTHLNKRLKL
jgi:hypothetical protein